MNIAVSSMGKDLNSMMDVRFGRCNYFVIYDTEGGLVKAIENKGQMSGGGAGIAAAQQIIDEDVDVVITGNMGPNAFNLFKNSDIKVYRCGSIKVETAVQLFKEGKLEELTQAGPAHSGMDMGAGMRFRGESRLNIAILSGKGGTGKTTISTNLSVITGANYIDCDVEEPNGFIFLNPSQIKREEVKVDYPVVDSSRCTLCGQCAKVCQFHALVRTKKDIMLFEKLCHGCHACEIVCKQIALTFEKREIGIIEEGRYGNLICRRGILNVGEPMAVPVIKKLLKNLPAGTNLIDCAPGTSCNVVNSLQYADGAILVTEPSSFGLHDLKMAVQLVRNFNLPFGVVINKYNAKDDRIQKYCEQEDINILGIIPYRREAAEVYSLGKMIVEMPEYKEIFEEIAKEIEGGVPLELTVISGKGGTGKTTIALALSELAKDAVKADCDVDAPNLYLFYDGRDIRKEYFYGEKKAVIDKKFCSGCKECEKVCQFDAIKDGIVNPFKCEGCGACILVCHHNAISLKEKKTADVYITQTDKGIISRAQMEVGSEGSGKLITMLRSNARKFSDENILIIIDGSPGIGCPVISSITGSDAVLIVTEPTQSGLEDFMRVMELCRHFGVLTLACINKYDINEKVAEEIESFCRENDIYLIGKIPYDDTVMKSINEVKPIVYYEGSKANQAIRQMWDNICKYIKYLNQ